MPSSASVLISEAYYVENMILQRYILCKTMFIVTQSTQSWYGHTIRLHVLHVSAYCDHHQVHNLYKHSSFHLASVYT
jgi:hypothetical protein